MLNPLYLYEQNHWICKAIDEKVSVEITACVADRAVRTRGKVLATGREYKERSRRENGFLRLRCSNFAFAWIIPPAAQAMEICVQVRFIELFL